MRELLFGCGALLLLTGDAVASQPLSRAELDGITAGAAGLPDWTGLPGQVFTSTTSGSAASSPDAQAGTFGLGEAGLTGVARLREYQGVVQFLSRP